MMSYFLKLLNYYRNQVTIKATDCEMILTLLIKIVIVTMTSH